MCVAPVYFHGGFEKKIETITSHKIYIDESSYKQKENRKNKKPNFMQKE